MFEVQVLIFSLISIAPTSELAVSTVSSMVLSFLNLFFIRLLKGVFKLSGEISQLLAISSLQVPNSCWKLDFWLPWVAMRYDFSCSKLDISCRESTIC